MFAANRARLLDQCLRKRGVKNRCSFSPTAARRSSLPSEVASRYATHRRCLSPGRVPAVRPDRIARASSCIGPWPSKLAVRHTPVNAAAASNSRPTADDSGALTACCPRPDDQGVRVVRGARTHAPVQRSRGQCLPLRYPAPRPPRCAMARARLCPRRESAMAAYWQRASSSLGAPARPHRPRDVPIAPKSNAVPGEHQRRGRRSLRSLRILQPGPKHVQRDAAL